VSDMNDLRKLNVSFNHYWKRSGLAKPSLLCSPIRKFSSNRRNWHPFI